MLSLAHTLISLPLAYYLEQPLLIFLAAVVGHFLCDSLLHWNLFHDQLRRGIFYLLVALDIGSGLVIAGLVVGSDIWTLPVLAAIIGGNLPDVLQQLYEKLRAAPRKKWLGWAAPAATWHDALQLETTDPLRGLVSQALLSGLAVSLVLQQIS
ncbi:MAG: hypothetical protein WEA04_05085 [Candidatus Andersenbacteria bacterium]